jgi:hypothetical protein
MKTIAQQIKWDFEANGSLKITAKNGFTIYFENPSGYWATRNYDSRGNCTYFEDTDRRWEKREYDSQRNCIYYEDSDGKIVDNRPKPCENKIVEIDGIKYKLTKA